MDATDRGKKSIHPDLKFLPDTPTSDDKFGVHKAIAEGLNLVVTGDLPKPVVIGLFGSWGSGKSSIVKMLQADSSRRFKIVLVDAWRKDKNNFLRQFVKKLSREILSPDETKKICEKVDFKTSTQDVQWIPGTWALTAIVLYTIATLFILLSVVYAWFRWHQNPEFHEFPLKEISGFAILILGAVAFQWLLPKYSQQIQSRNEEITIEDPGWFRKIYFEEILNRASGVPICIIIDNLDRVPTEDALAIIKFIKTFIVDVDSEEVSANKNKVTFIIPCDEDELVHRIESDESFKNPKEFLRKFFNISIRVPAMLEQDNIAYIRDLLSQAGIQCEASLLDNLAFIVSRACASNPRKPKTLLNHFVARFNLAKAFPDCRRKAEERPDWFAIHAILESEWSNLSALESVEHLRLATEGKWAGPLDSSISEFLRAMHPFAGEITPEAWHIFQFLKQPNVHDLIPGFRDMIQFALNRNTKKFNELFYKLNNTNNSLITYLWSERKDLPSRMAFAEAILSAHSQVGPFWVPKRILDDVGGMIQMMVTGWTDLPPGTTYELVLKPRPTCLRVVLDNLAPSNFDLSNPNSATFLHGLLSCVMQDNSNTSLFRTEIKKILEVHSGKDSELAQQALSFPCYGSNEVIKVNYRLLLDAKSKSEPQAILKYIIKFAEHDATNATATLNYLLTQMPSDLKVAPHLDFKPKLPLYELTNQLLRAWPERLQKLISFPLALFNTFQAQYSPCRNAAFWDGVYLIFASALDVCQFSDSSLKSLGSPYFSGSGQDFLTFAPENFVERAINNYASLIQQRHDFVVLPVRRSAKLAAVCFRNYPQHRPEILGTLVNSHPDWLETIVKELSTEKETSENLADLLLPHANSGYKPAIYRAIGEIKQKSKQFEANLEAHFDHLIRTPNMNTFINFENLLRAMNLANYTLTETQENLLRPAKDAFPVDQLTREQRVLLSSHFGDRKKTKKKQEKP